MNWIGGSRKRLLMKNEKKQREFFEKRRMQTRLQNLGSGLPATPQSSGGSSMDLVTLFIVNQIATKKEIKDPPKVAVFGGSKLRRNEPLVLPMSPCSPSQLSLAEDHPQCSVQGARKKKLFIPEGFKGRQLSPVLESAFSDCSAPDYLPPSPFCSTSSVSSGQGIFPLQRCQAEPQPHCSPSPWGVSEPEQNKFQPFSQPRGMTDQVSWSCGSNRPFFQLETPTAAQVLFGSSDTTEDRERQEVTFNQPEDKEPFLDFTLNQPEVEADVFRGFGTEECEREASHFGEGRKKIYLRDEAPTASSTPQTVPDSQCMEVEGSNYIHLPNCTDIKFACCEDNGFMNGCENSCRRCSSSSDSSDDEENCHPCLQAASSHMDHACCTASVTPNLSPQGNPNQRPTKPSTPPGQKVMENVVFQGGAAPQTQSSDLCKCRKASNETHDAGTQTVSSPRVETRDASTQCSDAEDGSTESTKFSLCLPPVDVSVQHPATRGQTDTAAEPSANTPPAAAAGGWRSGEQHTPWTKKISSFLPGSINTSTDGRVMVQRPIMPCSMTDSRDKETRIEREEQTSVRLMRNLSDEERHEVTSGTKRLSEEAHTLQEIADILLLLKQRKEVKENKVD